jgi:hypothetical protein
MLVGIQTSQWWPDHEDVAMAGIEHGMASITMRDQDNVLPARSSSKYDYFKVFDVAKLFDGVPVSGVPD